MVTLQKVPTQRLKTVILLPLACILLVSGIAGCRGGSRGAERIAEDSSAAQEFDSSLTFDNITLEQADDKGKLLWQVKAKQAVYTADKKLARVIGPEGELHQDGKPVFRVKAQKGEVRQDGERILLEGQIVATDIKSGAVLRGDQLVWTPANNILVVRNNLTGTHPRLRASAREAKVYSRERRMELQGQVVATAKNPDLRLRAEQLVWHMDKETVDSTKPIQVEKLQGNQVGDRASGNQANVDLKGKIVRLSQNAQLLLTKPTVQAASNLLVWNLNSQTVSAEQPVTIVHRQQQITTTANRGRMDLDRELVYLSSNVRAYSQRNRSQLSSDSLTWNIPTEQVTAEGSVVYQQSNPPATLRGPRAVGRLSNQTVVVSGGRVVTEIVPGQDAINQILPESR